MIVSEDAIKTLTEICKRLELSDIDYRVTGLTASNLYGYFLGTNVLDLVVISSDCMIKSIEVLDLGEKNKSSVDDLFTCELGLGYIRIQVDVLGDAVYHPLGIKLHSKELLLDRLNIYAARDMGNRVEKAMAFIALTLDEEKTEKYKYIWNRL